MQNPEDFRKKLLNRPQQIANQLMADEAARKIKELEDVERAKQYEIKWEQEKQKQRMDQLAILQGAYEKYGMQSKMEALAATIKNGCIVQTSDERLISPPDSTKPYMRISYNIPYRMFRGRILTKHSLSMPSGNNSVTTDYWETLSDPTDLSDSIGIDLQLEEYKGQLIRIIFHHHVWRPEPLDLATYKLLSLFEKGWEDTSPYGLDYMLFTFSEDSRPFSVTRFDQGLLSVYDSYLKTTNQIG